MHQEARSLAPQVSVVGIDIAPLGCHVVGMAAPGPVVRRTRVARREWLHVIATLPPARIGMEAGGSAHDWARRLREPG
jgi:transposase